MEWWEFVLTLLIAMPIIVLWLACIMDVIGRPDLSGWLKAAWTLGIILFPLIGSIAYIVFRPKIVFDSNAVAESDVYSSTPESLPTIDDARRMGT